MKRCESLVEHKCKICGKILNEETAYKIEYINKNGRKRHKYYCSEEEYNNYIKNRDRLKKQYNQKNYFSQLLEIFLKIMYLIELSKTCMTI